MYARSSSFARQDWKLELPRLHSQAGAWERAQARTAYPTIFRAFRVFRGQISVLRSKRFLYLNVDNALGNPRVIGLLIDAQLGKRSALDFHGGLVFLPVNGFAKGGCR